MDVLKSTEYAWIQAGAKDNNITIPSILIALQGTNWYIVMDDSSTIITLIGKSKDTYAVVKRKCQIEKRKDLGGIYLSYYIPQEVEVQVISCTTDRNPNSKNPVFPQIPVVLNNIYPIFFGTS